MIKISLNISVVAYLLLQNPILINLYIHIFILKDSFSHNLLLLFQYLQLKQMLHISLRHVLEALHQTYKLLYRLDPLYLI